ncbi:MAG TPA: acyl-CoA dehydrogenase family protein [Candidatus Binatia bacterium]|jgi:alkylation response protein AidB-like acyl-CoA dehydrogenase|nr:acyl-CoA dehydrogenase family protein [Candidatus Binatia bacterium]
MDLTYSPAEERFRAELRTWLEQHPPGEQPEALDAWVTKGKAWQRRLYEAGWCGIAWPAAYGGRGASLIQQIIFQEEMARARAPQLINLAGLTMGGPVLIAHGTEAQKQRHLQKILAADEIWCQGFSEPDAGSDLAALRTRAVLAGDHFVVSGQKVWTSFARYADWCMCLVRTNPTAPKHKGITFLLIDMHSPGVTVRPLKQINGDEDFNEVFFEDVRVPRANVVGAIDTGWDIAITCLMHERQTLTFSRQLQSRVALDEMLAMARRRGASADPVLRDRLAAAVIDAHAMQYTAYRNLTVSLRGGSPGPEGSIEKLFWSEMYQRQLEVALAACGPASQLVEGSAHAIDDGRWPHLYLYSRGRTIAAGSSEVQRNIIAERVLGLPRDGK